MAAKNGCFTIKGINYILKFQIEQNSLFKIVRFFTVFFKCSFGEHKRLLKKKKKKNLKI